MRTTTLLRTGVLALIVFLLPGCTQPKQQPLPVGNLKLGLAYYTQPKNNADMLAGYLPDSTTPIDSKVLINLDTQFAEVLRKESKNTFKDPAAAQRCARNTAADTARQPAIRTWSAVGRCMGVDLLVVPQIVERRERTGGEVGVAAPAKVIMDTFVVDVVNEQLISRSRYEEAQTALADNLLESGKFFKRGGKWVSTSDLAKEGMEKAVRDLGL